MKIEIAKRLYQYRTVAGLSQERVASRVGVSRQAVSKWECAESSPDTDNLISLAVLYGVSVDELLFADPEKGPTARDASGSRVADEVTAEAAEGGDELADENNGATDWAGTAEDTDARDDTGPTGSTAPVGSSGRAESAADNGPADTESTPGADRSSRWAGPDDGSDYVHVSFENGIHVRDTKKGEEVHVGWDGVHVDSATEHVHLDFAGLAQAIRELRKQQG